MSGFFAFVWFVTIIAFVAYYFKKRSARKAAGEGYRQDENYQQVSKVKRIIGVVCVLAFVLAGVTGEHDDGSSSASQTAEQGVDKPAKKSAEQIAQEKKAASDEVRQILGQIPQKVDEVEHQTDYKTWGEGGIQPETGIHFVVTVKDKTVSPIQVYVIQFTEDTNWVFWDKMVFANGDQKWDKSINAIAGQSGDGKDTQVVWGGKYETWHGKFADVEKGMQILANGDKPILRLTGQYSADVYPTDSDIQRVKTAIRLNELLKKIDNTLVD